MNKEQLIKEWEELGFEVGENDFDIIFSKKVEGIVEGFKITYSKLQHMVQIERLTRDDAMRAIAVDLNLITLIQKTMELLNNEESK